MDELLNQIVNISKANAYDIVSKQVQELQAENAALKERVKELETKIEFLEIDIEELNNPCD